MTVTITPTSRVYHQNVSIVPSLKIFLNVIYSFKQFKKKKPKHRQILILNKDIYIYGQTLILSNLSRLYISNVIQITGIFWCIHPLHKVKLSYK